MQRHGRVAGRSAAANLQGKGLGALAGAAVKKAATARVFGFEIMPAPFVVAHLQVGLTLQALDAPLTDAPIPSSSSAPSPSPSTGSGTGRGSPAPAERPGIFFTNALTAGNRALPSHCRFPNWRTNATGRNG